MAHLWRMSLRALLGRTILLLALASFGALVAFGTSFSPVATGPLSAQSPGGWNSPRALELVERGREQRRGMASDSTLRSWEAEARGHVYFLLEQDQTGERTLIKADQLALDVYWRAPGLVRQHIVGRRDEARLPTTIRYHIDHLTVVTDDFDDRIALGEGDEVRSVIHPLAPASGDTYDFQLGDSLTLTFPGRGEEIRVYEIHVRPKDSEEPGVVGNVFLDRESAAVVRMGLTFTPASYVDPLLDHIRLTLDNGLWEGRYWLPYRQELEIRRELPYLDLPAGTVIRVRWDIGPYRLNPGLPRSFFSGPPIRSRPTEDLESFPFEEGLYARLDDEGLAPTPELEDVQQRARQMVLDQRLSGLSPVRLFAPSASALFRHDRAEGVRLGAGISVDPRDDLSVDLRGGWAFARAEPDLAVQITGDDGGPGTGIRAYWNDLRDLGPVAGASGAVSSLSSLSLETDYRDPWFASGVELFHQLGDRNGVGPYGGGGETGPMLRLAARYEEHERASLVLDDPTGSYRPLPAVDEGDLVTLDADLLAGVSESVALGAGLTLARLDGSGWMEARGSVDWSRDWRSRDLTADARLQAGVLSSRSPVQRLYHLGGRKTLPGFPYRGIVGDGYWLLRASGSWGIVAPWIRPRLLLSAGSAWNLADRSVAGAPAVGTGTPRFSVGAGMGLFWDIIRVDVARGIDGGEWEWILSVNRDFWPLL